MCALLGRISQNESLVHGHELLELSACVGPWNLWVSRYGPRVYVGRKRLDKHRKESGHGAKIVTFGSVPEMLFLLVTAVRCILLD